jgi:hypothetical protein
MNPNDPIFQELDIVISAIKDKILKAPGIEVITATDIASIAGLDVKRVEQAFYEICQLGSFCSGAGGSTDNPRAYQSLSLVGDKGYDAYLSYDGILNVLERFYLERAPRQSTQDTIQIFRTGEGTMISSNWNQPLVQTAIKQNTAFVLMAIDPKNPAIEDVYFAIKEVCGSFGIKAYRADQIEHQDRITDLILREIESCEFLIADLTYERPNVYYEIGYAHALQKKPILYRRLGTQLHFDLSVHNIPEYRNATELRDLLKRRLESILGRTAKAS